MELKLGKVRCIACGKKISPKNNLHGSDCGYLCPSCAIAYNIGVVQATRDVKEKSELKIDARDVHASLKELREIGYHIFDILNTMRKEKK